MKEFTIVSEEMDYIDTKSKKYREECASLKRMVESAKEKMEHYEEAEKNAIEASERYFMRELKAQNLFAYALYNERYRCLKNGSAIKELEYEHHCREIEKAYEEYELAAIKESLAFPENSIEIADVLEDAYVQANIVLHRLQHELYKDHDRTHYRGAYDVIGERRLPMWHLKRINMIRSSKAADINALR